MPEYDPYANPQPCDNCGHPIPFDVDENTVMATKPCLNCESGGAHYGPKRTGLII